MARESLAAQKVHLDGGIPASEVLNQGIHFQIRFSQGLVL